MLDIAIQQFLVDRKEAWLKKKLTANKSEEEQLSLRSDAQKLFSLSVWLPDAAKRAKQLNLVTHPSKFSHSGAKTSSIIANCPSANDGFLRFGNVQDLSADVFGNAAAMDVHKFLSLQLQDGLTVLEHLEQQTEIIKKQFKLESVDFEELHQGFMAIKTDSYSETTTSGKLKQVYFPVPSEAEGYHLLSLLTSSGLMYKLKERINHIRFSEQSKQAKADRKKNEFNQFNVQYIDDLTAIGFGGTKPQNISVLNSQNGGVALLLNSMPPSLEFRNIRLPKTSFFKNTLYEKNFTNVFFELKQILKIDWQNNMNIRNDRDKLYQEALFQAAEVVWQVRAIKSGWSKSDTYDALPKWQKIWLDNDYIEDRLKNDDYIEQATLGFSRWFLAAFERYLKKEKLFSDIDLAHFLKEAIGINKETKLHIQEAFK